MNIKDPLGTVRLYLQLNPNEEENSALRKLLVALANLENAEPVRNAILFQGELGELTAALLNTRMNRQYSAEQWQEATNF